jgi:hypothetical protein
VKQFLNPQLRLARRCSQYFDERDGQKKFYARKIKQLTDDKLKELLQLKNKENLDIIALAEKEGIERCIA